MAATVGLRLLLPSRSAHLRGGEAPLPEEGAVLLWLGGARWLSDLGEAKPPKAADFGRGLAACPPAHHLLFILLIKSLRRRGRRRRSLGLPLADGPEDGRNGEERRGGRAEPAPRSVFFPALGSFLLRDVPLPLGRLGKESVELSATARAGVRVPAGG